MPEMRLQPAIGTTFDYSIPLEPMLEMIRESGFEHVAIGMDLDHSCYHTPGGRKNLAALLDRFNLSIDSIHANYMHKDADIGSLDNDLRLLGVEDFKSVIDATSEMGAQIVVFHPHNWYDLADRLDERIAAVLKSVESMVSYAGKKDIKLAAENLFRNESTSILETCFASFSPDDLGFCYDSSHDNITPDSSLGELLSRHSNRLLTTHFSDNMGKQDDHMIPYMGSIDFRKVAGSFPLDTYKGNLLLETEIRLHENLKTFPAEFLRNCFDASMRMRNEILMGN
jgi:L-ribulose-5-phosphate 3-epimerase